MQPTNTDDVTAVTARLSGAPEAGGATTPHSSFGGDTLTARFLRLVARVARDFEASAYRGLRDLERGRAAAGCTSGPGAPRRTREAAPHGN